MNALRHGLTACSSILLACESREEFDRMAAEYNAIYQPVGPEENGFVREMISARWRIQRIGTAEAAVIDLEMVRKQPEVEEEFTDADPGVLLGVAIRSLADESRSLALISRYESRLRRTHDRARRTLRELQQERKSRAEEAQPPQPEPLEPTPQSDAPPATESKTSSSDGLGDPASQNPASSCGHSKKSIKEPNIQLSALKTKTCALARNDSRTNPSRSGVGVESMLRPFPGRGPRWKGVSR